MPTLNSLLQEARQSRGMTLQDVHNASGLESQLISDFENGKTDLSLSAFFQLCHAYRQPPVSLLLRSEKISADEILEEAGRMKSDQPGPVFRLGELFCGPGGLAVGAMKASAVSKGVSSRIRHAWATDYDESTCRTYTANVCPESPESVICEDIRRLDYDLLQNISEIDALAFGFPCNDFSVVGRQKGLDGDYGPLYSYGVKALKKFRPKWFLAENVSGLKSASEGEVFHLILRELQEAGYRITPHLYKFEEYGIPQARHRIIIVGIRDDLPIEFRVPSPAPYAGVDNTVRTALENPPIPENAPNNERTRQSPQVIERLKYIKPGQNAFTADLPESLRLRVRGAKISQIYKRLDPSKPSYTVTGSGGGGTHMYHWSEPRALTNRERARIQTFPDDFEFMGSKENVRRQIGMAVPCRGAQILFEAILKSFAGIEYPWIDPNLRVSDKNK